MSKGKVYWLTGLSGSGKSTLAQAVSDLLIKDGVKVTIIDGDTVRDSRERKLGFTKEDILTNNKLILDICNERKNHFDTILVPVIAPYREFRDQAKKDDPNGFFEILIAANLDTVRDRDTKGLYKKAESGEIDNMIGFSESNPYETPKNPDLIIDSSGNSESVSESALKLYKFIAKA
ncbi:adenylyl-sulfate kinase [Halobacteriovorax sp. HLS]|uniref:adenylyl-sulfate kinase n=1 Tax=Halobacteriovorax sp. HLS TaxID=2234000 RepID=UPI000FD84351|nr:adenylyl-sulfate kinase [Halobacteriovorax sp. HLS]